MGPRGVGRRSFPRDISYLRDIASPMWNVEDVTRLVDPKQKQYLLAGGVCQDPKENWKNTDGCSRSDMVKINIELVIFDTTASFGHGDFVIIQVSDSVTKLFPQRISFACLPSHKDEPAPSTITLYGWGKTGHHKDGATTPHLRYVTVNVVQSNYRSFRISGKAPDDSPNQSIGKGDSGSGGVHFDKATDKHILWGVASSGGISDELSDAIGWDCLRKQATSSIGLYECEMETSWAMAVVSANLEVLCDAISVTDQHLLTSRECILPVLKTLSKTVPQESVFVMHRSCLTEECAKYPMEDIGYSYYHDFAIIQLRSVPNPDIIPVCFLSSDGAGQLDKHEDGHARQLRAYDKILTLVKQSDFEIENQTT
ncbi:trypsin domain-containing protein [Ditylenchus destructor]|uniref:Trypsin domain-containing protein n=1 Tax=Ditylenchus destructor TaxID=166010 RepID=A0AAD4QSY3_9BILA|nr:trypsin domain-containing protein [Ditylenchus destructor]